MFQIDVTCRKSIYAQVMDNLKALMLSGELPPGAKLPSVRELSKNIAVNPNTVQKAYRELERQGFLYTTAGVGTFVADRSNLIINPASLDAALSKVAEAFRELLYLGLPFDEAVAQVHGVIAQLKKSNNNTNEEKEEK
jgi:GntR family transcriptional regulator